MTDVNSDMVLFVDQQIEIEAGAGVVFEALLERLGPQMQTPDGQLLSMRLEARPGGRWYRDLGDDQGHLWGHVQVIKRPAVLELSGPMFMSYAAISHLQLKLTEQDGRTLVALRFEVLGRIADDHREGVTHGWNHLLKGVKEDAERQ